MVIPPFWIYLNLLDLCDVYFHNGFTALGLAQGPSKETFMPLQLRRRPAPRATLASMAKDFGLEAMLALVDPQPTAKPTERVNPLADLLAAQPQEEPVRLELAGNRSVVKVLKRRRVPLAA